MTNELTPQLIIDLLGPHVHLAGRGYINRILLRDSIEKLTEALNKDIRKENWNKEIKNE